MSDLNKCAQKRLKVLLLTQFSQRHKYISCVLWPVLDEFWFYVFSRLIMITFICRRILLLQLGLDRHKKTLLILFDSFPMGFATLLILGSSELLAQEQAAWEKYCFGCRSWEVLHRGTIRLHNTSNLDQNFLQSS